MKSEFDATNELARSVSKPKRVYPLPQGGIKGLVLSNRVMPLIALCGFMTSLILLANASDLCDLLRAIIALAGTSISMFVFWG